MDLAKVIRLLRVKLHQVDKQIAAAEEALRKQQAQVAPRQRGRTSMGAEERKQVAQRMRRYWAARKKEGQAAPQRPGQWQPITASKATVRAKQPWRHGLHSIALLCQVASSELLSDCGGPDGAHGLISLCKAAQDLTIDFYGSLQLA
jgi:hypothetical protein